MSSEGSDFGNIQWYIAGHFFKKLQLLGLTPVF
jgi:hypothetical protein